MVDFIRKPLEGIFPLTPFALRPGTQDVDYDAIKNNIRLLKEKELPGFIAFGCMGQHHAPSEEEFNKVVDVSINAATGDQVCVIGTTAPNTKEAIRRTQYAEDAGADGCMLALPYCFPVAPHQAIEHYRLVNDAIRGDLAIMVYNIPSVSRFNITANAWLDLLKLENIKALKESNGDLMHRISVLQTIAGKVNVFSGTEAWFWFDSMLGAKGIVAQPSWAAPKAMLKFYAECMQGNWFESWTLKVLKKLLSVFKLGVTVPMATYEHGILNAMVEIGGGKTGPVRQPYESIPESDVVSLKKQLQELAALV